MAISISDLVKQNTQGQSEGFPLGVPQSYNWYQGWNPGGQLTPPANFTAVEGWGQIYPEVGQPVSTTADVQIANAQTWVHIKQTNQWVEVQDQSQLGLTGGHFLADFSGNSATAMPATALPGGGTSFDAPAAGYNDHFWYGSRGTYAAGTVDAVYVQMDMRTTDPTAHLVAMVGADWWQNASVGFVPDHSTNPGVGGSNWVELSTQWQTVGYYSMSTAQFEADLPPPLVGAAQSSPVVPPDTLAPAAPQITAFTPDTGTVGDKVTDASILTLTGTAEAGSSVKLFDGTSVIGTVTASASGVWSLTTAQMSSGVHSFSATATDAAGNTSVASSLLSVTVNPPGQTSVTSPPASASNNLLVNGSLETASPPVTTPPATSPTASASNNLLVNGSFETASPPVTTPPATTSTVTGTNLLANGSFEESTLAPHDAGRWGVNGPSEHRWGAFSSVPGWTAIGGSTIELWNHLNGVDAADGHDNVALVAKPANTTSAASVASVADQSVNLMKQYAATSFAGASSGVTAVTGTSTNTSQDQTLASAHH